MKPIQFVVLNFVTVALAICAYDVLRSPAPVDAPPQSTDVAA